MFAGLPPDTDKDLKVRSIGQGNSLMDPGTKILQTMATLCSCLTYFGQAVLVTCQEEDRQLVEDTLSTLPLALQDRVQVLQVAVKRPSSLPFHALIWSQEYIKALNCNIAAQYSPPSSSYSSSFSSCPGRFFNGMRSPLNVTYFREAKAVENTAIQFVYYTESDQILRIPDANTLAALTAVSNESCFFFPRRREKQLEVTHVKAIDEEVQRYMEGLHGGRSCGGVGYAITWPNSSHVQPYSSQYS